MGQCERPLDINNFRKRVFYKALKKAKLPQIRVLIQSGESLAYVRDQMGHYSIQVTVDIYGHLVPGGNKDAVDRLDDLEPTQQSATNPQPNEKGATAHEL